MKYITFLSLMIIAPLYSTGPIDPALRCEQTAEVCRTIAKKLDDILEKQPIELSKARYEGYTKGFVISTVTTSCVLFYFWGSSQKTLPPWKFTVAPVINGAGALVSGYLWYTNNQLLKKHASQRDNKPIR